MATQLASQLSCMTISPFIDRPIVFSELHAHSRIASDRSGELSRRIDTAFVLESLYSRLKYSEK